MKKFTSLDDIPQNDIPQLDVGRKDPEEWETKDGVLENVDCTAGIDYFIMGTNGDIYRCYGYYHDAKYKLCDLDNFKEFDFDNRNGHCDKMNCFKDCEGFKVQVWKKDKTKVWDKVYWRKRFNSIQEASQDKTNFMLQPDLVDGCFNACSYCFIDNPDAKKMSNVKCIDSSKIISFLEYMAQKRTGSKFINISGSGEAMLHPNIVEIVDAATSLDYRIELITSGLLNHKKIFEFKHPGHIWLIISYHVVSPNWSFKKIESLIKQAKEKGFGGVNSTLVKHPKNMESYNQFVELNKKYDMFMYEIDYRPQDAFTQQFNNKLMKN